MQSDALVLTMEKKKNYDSDVLFYHEVDPTTKVSHYYVKPDSI